MSLPKPFSAYVYRPLVSSGRAADRMRNVLAMNQMPTPVMTHAMMMAPAEASAAMFCGRL